MSASVLHRPCWCRPPWLLGLVTHWWWGDAGCGSPEAGLCVLCPQLGDVLPREPAWTNASCSSLWSNTTNQGRPQLLCGHQAEEQSGGVGGRCSSPCKCRSPCKEGLRNLSRASKHVGGRARSSCSRFDLLTEVISVLWKQQWEGQLRGTGSGKCHV